MQITKIEPFGKDKIKLYFDDDYRFWLFRKDADNYHLTEGQELAEEVYQEMFYLAVNQAKQKALLILERMNRTKQELLGKLEEAAFTKEVSELALAYVKQFHYIDDYRYAVTYLRNHAASKSKRNLTEVLKSKGIDLDTIERAYEEVEEEADSSLEQAALKKELKRFQKKTTQNTIQEKKKWIASLMRKGFSYDLIRREIGTIEDNINN